MLFAQIAQGAAQRVHEPVRVRVYPVAQVMHLLLIVQAKQLEAVHVTQLVELPITVKRNPGWQSKQLLEN